MTGFGGMPTVVVLRSSSAEQPFTDIVLGWAGFGVIRRASIAHLETADAATTCAYIVEASFLSLLSRDAQAEVFEKLSKLSTTSLILVDEGSLRLRRDEVVFAVHKNWFRKPPVDLLGFVAGALGEAELQRLQAVRATFERHATVRVVPGGIAEASVSVLVGAIESHLVTRYGGTGAVDEIRISAVVGGMSGAGVFVVETGPPHRVVIVAKVDAPTRLYDEMQRFTRFARYWAGNLQPFLDVRGEHAVLLLDLVADAQSRKSPARTLGRWVEDLWNAECFGESEDALDIQVIYLDAALHELSRKLLDLNRRDPGDPDREIPDVAPYTDHVLALIDSGLAWDLPPDFRKSLELCWSRYKRLERKGTVHGDLHLDNVLVRGPTEIHVVDFAAMGPGHPAVDLARLDVLLFCQWFRELGTEEERRELQRLVTLGSIGQADLDASFPTLIAARTNKVCARGCLYAAAAGVTSVEKHGGTIDDYIATKYLMAFQSLAIPRTDSSLARSIIWALDPLVKNA